MKVKLHRKGYPRDSRGLGPSQGYFIFSLAEIQLYLQEVSQGVWLQSNWADGEERGVWTGQVKPRENYRSGWVVWVQNG